METRTRSERCERPRTVAAAVTEAAAVGGGVEAGGGSEAKRVYRRSVGKITAPR